MEELALTHQVMLLIISSLLSGLAGAGLTTWWQVRLERRRDKIALLAELQAYSPGDSRFIEALNKVPLVFNDSQPVMAAFDRVLDAHVLPGDQLQKLMAMAMSSLNLPHPHRDSLVHRYDTKPRMLKPDIKPDPKEKEEMERWDVERRALKEHKRMA